MLCANEAWAYGMLNRPEQAQKMLGRTKDEFARADVQNRPDWARSFDDSDVHSMAASMHDALAVFDPERHAPLAVAETIKGNEGYGADMRRSYVFGLSRQATNHIRAGDLAHGLKVGRQALEMGQEVNSVRVADRIQPLQIEAAKHRMNPDARELAEDIRVFREAR